MKTLGTIIIALLLVGVVMAGEVDLKGAGTLTAQGKGVIKIMGAGDVTISGNGMLWVVDCSWGNDVQIDVQGNGKKVKKMPAYVYAYKGFKGTATITGSGMKILCEGKDLQLTVTGKGKVHLFGRGTWSKGTQTGEWSEIGEGAPVDLGTTAATE